MNKYVRGNILYAKEKSQQSIHSTNGKQIEKAHESRDSIIRKTIHNQVNTFTWDGALKDSLNITNSCLKITRKQTQQAQTIKVIKNSKNSLGRSVNLLHRF